jgi:hypothetical protein
MHDDWLDIRQKGRLIDFAIGYFILRRAFVTRRKLRPLGGRGAPGGYKTDKRYWEETCHES